MTAIEFKGNEIILSDATLRDGSHAIKHQLSVSHVDSYCASVDSVGIDWVEVGHGNGLGASSFHIGLSAAEDSELIGAARSQLKNTKLSVHVMPGIASLKRDVAPATEQGVDVFRIGSHCSEADTTFRYLEYVRNADKTAVGVLMMIHMLSAKELVLQARGMQAAGAQAIMLMDSAGALRMSDVAQRVAELVGQLDVPVGIHAHDNLGLSVANSLIAVESGARILDACAAGFGAGAGNAPMEVLIPLLRESNQTAADHHQYFRVVDEALTNFIPSPQTLSTGSVATGLAGIFSGFLKPIIAESNRYGIDKFQLIEELGRRHPVAGQEDLVIEVAKELGGK
jgi:4-hydroxy 2-oxovalerate aldolase